MKQLIAILLVVFPISGITQTQTTWNVSLWGERRAFTEHIEKLAELVEQKTNGEFQLNLSYGGLAQPRDNLGGIANGAFDMAQTCADFHVEKTPALTVLELPYLGISTLREERSISQFLLRQPAVTSNLQQYNAVALMPTPLPQQNLAGTGDSPKTLSDFAGLRVRATAGTAQAMEALGAIPSSLAAIDARDAMAADRIHAAAFAPHEHMSFGTIANATWWTENLNPGTVNCPVIANINSINSLSPQHRAALYDSINQSLDHYVHNYEYNLSQSWEPVLQELGVEKVYFPQAEVSAFHHQAAAAAAQQWIQENKARGIDAQPLYESLILALYAENPQDIPKELPVMTEAKKKQQILDNYAFNKVPTTAQLSAQQPQPERTFSFDKKPSDALPVATTFPVEAPLPNTQEIPVSRTGELPKSNTRIENIADVTVAALPASATGPLFFGSENERPSNQQSTTVANADSSREIPPLEIALPVDTPRSNTRIENIADVTLAALPASTTGPQFFGVGNEIPTTTQTATEFSRVSNNVPSINTNTYFGPPRNGTIKNLTSNPIEMTVEWDLDNNATVGGTLQQLAQYIGYTLIDDETGISVFNRKLPAVQRKVQTISVADGFEVISGQSLMTVFNHVDRTVRHLPEKTATTRQAPQNSVTTKNLSACRPDDITLTSIPKDGVVRLANGIECLLR